MLPLAYQQPTPIISGSTPATPSAGFLSSNLDNFQALSSLAGVGVAGAGLISNIYNNYQARKDADRAYNFAKEQFAYSKYANENAVSIRAKDLQNAGLSKYAAAGASSSFTPSAYAAAGAEHTDTYPLVAALGQFSSAMNAIANRQALTMELMASALDGEVKSRSQVVNNQADYFDPSLFSVANPLGQNVDLFSHGIDSKILDSEFSNPGSWTDIVSQSRRAGYFRNVTSKDLAYIQQKLDNYFGKGNVKVEYFGRAYNTPLFKYRVINSSKISKDDLNRIKLNNLDAERMKNFEPGAFDPPSMVERLLKDFNKIDDDYSFD